MAITEVSKPTVVDGVQKGSKVRKEKEKRISPLIKVSFSNASTPAAFSCIPSSLKVKA